MARAPRGCSASRRVPWAGCRIPSSTGLRTWSALACTSPSGSAERSSGRTSSAFARTWTPPLWGPREPAPRRATGGPWTGSSGGRSASTSAATLTSRSRPRRPRNASSARSRWTTASPSSGRSTPSPTRRRAACCSSRCTSARWSWPGLWLNARAGIPMTAPMETVGERGAAGLLRDGRGAAGHPVVPPGLGGASSSAALQRGEAVALVVGPGRRRHWPFGRALRGTGAVAGRARAVGRGERRAPSWSGRHAATAGRAYRGRLVPIQVRRGGLAARARRGGHGGGGPGVRALVADAPEQWWTLFFPDLGCVAPGARRIRTHDQLRLGRADLHIHRWPRTASRA